MDHSTTLDLSVSVPATTANLGPGYDTLGLALDLRLTATAAISDQWRVQLEGEGHTELPRDESNLMIQAYQRLCEHKGWDVSPLDLHVNNPIPLGRGLGSSAAAIVAGLALAQLAHGGSLSREELFQHAHGMEGHGDNVGPATFGGLQRIVGEGEGIKSQPCALHPAVKVLLVIPAQAKSTVRMRQVVPDEISREDQIVTAVALEQVLKGLAEADPEALRYCREDRRHQPYRLQAQPESAAIFDLLCELPELAGAYLSGAGTTVGAWVLKGDPCAVVRDRIAGSGITARVQLAAPDSQGVTVKGNHIP